MARIALIPARVAVGFTRGDQQADGSWVVTTHDAHAWPELYFAGYGWVPFEPTPRTDGQVLTPSYTLPASSTGKAHGAQPGDTKSGKQTATPGRRNGNLPNGLRDRSGGSGATGSSGSAAASQIGIAIGCLVVVALCAPAVGRFVIRRRRRRRFQDPVEGSAAAWAELRDCALDVGMSWDPGRSPRALARQVSTALSTSPDSNDALARLCRREEHARYAAVTPAPDGSVRHDLDVVRRALRDQQSTRGRLRAVLLPRSVLLWAAGHIQQLAGLLADLPGRVAQRLPVGTLRTGRGAS